MKMCVLLLPYERVALSIHGRGAGGNTSEASFEGEAPVAYATGGGDASPNNCMAGSLFAL